mgnify:CR=1 FL=1
MGKKRKPSKEARKTKYWVRALKRISIVIVWLFIVFCLIMFVIWAVPQIWTLALG